MHDEFAGAGHVTGEGVANKGSPAQSQNNQATRRIQRAVAQAPGARDQFSGVRARPLAAAAIAFSVGCLLGRRR